MNRPMTTEELFNRIRDMLKEKGRLPAILGYGLAARRPAAIRTYEFDLTSRLSHGGSEGIYLDLWIKYSVSGGEEKKKLGTFKTLYEDNEAMHVMAGLLPQVALGIMKQEGKCSGRIIWKKECDKTNLCGRNVSKAGLNLDIMIPAKTGRQVNVFLNERGILPISLFNQFSSKCFQQNQSNLTFQSKPVL